MMKYIRGIAKKCNLLWLYNLNTSVSKKNIPLLACVPDDTIGREIIVNGLYEEKLLKALFECILVSWIQEFKTGAILDVGANIGNHTCFFARYFRQVVAFEPNPVSYRLLQANIALNSLNNVIIRKVGLSDQSADLTFVQTRGNLGGSGFFEANNDRNDVKSVLRVEIGDSELNKIDINVPIRMIKVDVEGHEYPALKGLKNTIEVNKPILMFEIHPFSANNGVALFDYLRDLGYLYFYSVEPQYAQKTVDSLIGRLMAFFSVDGDYICKRITNPDNRLYIAIIAYTKPIC